MVIRGLGGCINVLDEYVTYVTQHVSVVKALHMLSYGHQGVRGGGGIKVLDEVVCEKITQNYCCWYSTNGTWKHLKKLRPMSMLSTSKCTKKDTLGLTAAS